MISNSEISQPRNLKKEHANVEGRFFYSRPALYFISSSFEVVKLFWKILMISLGAHLPYFTSVTQVDDFGNGNILITFFHKYRIRIEMLVV